MISRNLSLVESISIVGTKIYVSIRPRAVVVAKDLLVDTAVSDEKCLFPAFLPCLGADVP